MTAILPITGPEPITDWNTAGPRWRDHAIPDHNTLAAIDALTVDWEQGLDAWPEESIVRLRMATAIGQIRALTRRQP